MKSIIPIVAFLFFISFPTNAQSSADSSTFKAVYVESGPNFFPKGRHLGGTLLAKGQWFVAGRMGWTDESSPQLTHDYRPPTATYSGPGTSGGNCTFCVVPDIDIYGGDERSGPNTDKSVRTFSTSVGYLFHLFIPGAWLRVEAGMARLKVEEAVDFVFIPDSEEDLGSGVVLTRTSGYAFTRETRKHTGLFLGAGLEYPLNNWLGLSMGCTVALAKDEKQVGLNLGLLVGILQ